MNNNYYPNPTFPGADTQVQESTEVTQEENELPMQQNYIENILALNKGKVVKIYVSYPDSNEWHDKVYDGIIEEVGKDHLIVSNPKTGEWYVILIIYINYFIFDEKINYKRIYSDKNF